MLRKFCLTTLLFSSCISPALAQSSDIFTVADSRNDSFLDVGLVGVTRDPYVGSDQTDYVFLPYVHGEYKGRLFANAALGAGMHLINKEKIRFSTSANYALGRDDKDTPFVNSNDAFRIDGSFTANAAARVYLPFAALDVVGSVPVTGDLNGSRVDALLTTELYPISNLRINPGVRATYTSGGWNNSFYGINAQQAEAAKLTPLSYSSGINTFGAHAAAYWTITDDFEVVSLVNYSILTGNLKDSPLTPDNSGVTAAIGIARKF